MKRWQKAAYGMGSLGNNIIYGFLATYLIVFYTDFFGISPTVVATIFLVARIWDAIFDQIMGVIVDHTKTRWGKFRPYLFFVAPIMATLTVLCFSAPDLSETNKIIYAYVTYIAFSMSFAMMDIPYWSMSASLTQDTNERNRIVMISRTTATFGTILVNVVTLPLVKMLSGGEMTQQGWQLTALVLGATAILCTWVTAFSLKETVVQDDRHSYSIKEMFSLIKSNKPLLILLVSLFVFEVVFFLKFIYPNYYLKYNYEAENLIPMFMGMYAVATILGSVLSPTASRKIGKKKVALTGIFLMCISSIGLYFTSYPNLTFLIFWNGLTGLGYGFANIALMSMLTDTVEYGEYVNGKRTEGLVFSLNIFKTKVASAIGGAVGAFSLGLTGYVANGVQSVSTLNGIHFLFSLLPGILMLLALYPLSKYTLTEQQYEEILIELKDRKNEVTL